MTDVRTQTERLRDRLAAVGVDLPPAIVDLVVVTTGSIATALDDLAALPFGDCEPFCPRRLADDAS